MIGKWLVETCGSHGLIWARDGDAVMTYYEWLGFIWCWCWWWCWRRWQWLSKCWWWRKKFQNSLQGLLKRNIIYCIGNKYAAWQHMRWNEYIELCDRETHWEFFFARANLEWGDCHGGINPSKLQVYYRQRSKNALATVNDEFSCVSTVFWSFFEPFFVYHIPNRWICFLPALKHGLCEDPESSKLRTSDKAKANYCI